MGMPLQLVSNHRLLEVRQHARHSYRCDGHHKDFPNLSSSPECEAVIQKGKMYVAKVEWEPQKIGPHRKIDAGKYCAHCALALFADIKIAGGHAA